MLVTALIAALVLVVFPLIEGGIDLLKGDATPVTALRHVTLAYGMTRFGLPIWAACLLTMALWIGNDLRDPEVGINPGGWAWFAGMAAVWVYCV